MKKTNAIASIMCLLAFLNSPVLAQNSVAEEPPSPASIEAAFQRSLIAIDGGDYATAVRLLRAILAVDPTLVRVRLELARSHFLTRDWVEAEREFFAVLSGDIPPAVRANVQNFLRAIDARRGLDWSFSASFSPNIVRARRYVTDTIELNFLGQNLPFTLNRASPPDFTVSASGGIELQQPVPGEPGTLVFGGGFGRADLAPGSDHDDVFVGLRAGLRFVGAETATDIGPVASLRWTAGNWIESRLGAEIGHRRRLPQGLTVAAALRAEQVRDLQDDSGDGPAFGGRLGLRRSLGGRASVGIALRGERHEAELPSRRLTEIGFGVSGQSDVGRGLRLDGQISYTRQAFDEPAPLFLQRRSDRVLGGRVRLTAQTTYLFRRFSPFVEVLGERRRSNIDAFGYDELGLRFGIERAF